nr:hypothetical protein [Sporosarcina sp. NCCP-2716]
MLDHNDQIGWDPLGGKRILQDDQPVMYVDFFDGAYVASDAIILPDADLCHAALHARRFEKCLDLFKVKLGQYRLR